MAIPYVPPPGQPGGGDSGARAAGFGDYSEYQHYVDEHGGQSAVSGSGSTGSLSGVTDIAKQLQEMQNQANQPYINSLQSSIGETQAKFTAEGSRLQAQIQPLTDRYNNLLQEITGNQQLATKREQTATSREFGRRGISTESGLYDQTMNERLLPIEQYYTGQYKDTSFAREQAIQHLQDLMSQLPYQSTEAVRAIQNAIAQMQSGANSNAVSSALDMYRLQQQMAAANQSQQVAAPSASLAQPLYGGSGGGYTGSGSSGGFTDLGATPTTIRQTQPATNALTNFNSAMSSLYGGNTALNNSLYGSGGGLSAVGKIYGLW